jgi:NAD-dependent dihydropyrimidine dehydrogenase PreA subunit
MTLHLPIPRHTETPYIHLDTSRCKACWECVQACRQGVLGKVDFRFHRHAHIDRAENCKGCLLCLDACPHQAVLIREETHDIAPR